MGITRHPTSFPSCPSASSRDTGGSQGTRTPPRRTPTAQRSGGRADRWRPRPWPCSAVAGRHSGRRRQSPARPRGRPVASAGQWPGLRAKDLYFKFPYAIFLEKKPPPKRANAIPEKKTSTDVLSSLTPPTTIGWWLEKYPIGSNGLPGSQMETTQSHRKTCCS